MKIKNNKLLTAILGISSICYASMMPAYAFSPATNQLYQGIDVSEWQGNIDFAAVKAAGQDFVYIRASVGSDYTDACLQQNYAGASAAGMNIGFYHYLMAQNVADAQAEAAYFASVIKGMDADCRLAMDYENFSNLDNSQINAVSLAFLQTLEQLTGQQTVIYSDAYDAGSIFGEVLANYPLWVADYDVSEPYGNNIWSEWVGWQYSDSGSVNGISGNVDMDSFTADILQAARAVSSSSSNTGNSSNIIYITVAAGDTLSGIAAEYGVALNELVQWNNISDPNLIYPGQVLTIYTQAAGNNDITYTVQAGDTLWSIAQEYNTSIADILADNPSITNANLIYPNEMLSIP